MCSDIRVSNLYDILTAHYSGQHANDCDMMNLSVNVHFVLFFSKGIHNRRKYRGLGLTSVKGKGLFFCSQKDFTFSTGKPFRTYNILIPEVVKNEYS